MFNQTVNRIRGIHKDRLQINFVLHRPLTLLLASAKFDLLQAKLTHAFIFACPSSPCPPGVLYGCPLRKMNKKITSSMRRIFTHPVEVFQGLMEASISGGGVNLWPTKLTITLTGRRSDRLICGKSSDNLYLLLTNRCVQWDWDVSLHKLYSVTMDSYRVDASQHFLLG